MRLVLQKIVVVSIGLLLFLPAVKAYAQGGNVCGEYKVEGECRLLPDCRWDSGTGVCREKSAEEDSPALICGFLTDSVTCTSENACVWDNQINECRGKTAEELEGREKFFSEEVTEAIGKLNPTGVADVQTLIGRIIKIFMQVVGSIALLMFIYGGVLWMIDAGNSEKQKQAMKIIVWSSLGIVVILASYILVDFAFEAFR